MKYISTRGRSGEMSSAEAIISGIAGDGGLFVPDEIPKVSRDFIMELAAFPYEERAMRILGLFLTDYSVDEIASCVSAAYGGTKFDAREVAPPRVVGDMTLLELWHGPTSAFKDMALQILPHLLGTALKKTGESREVLILVATSGDTGKAALAGFADAPGTKIMVFYPDGGVSEIQRLQMVTQAGGNVRAVAVRGNFDDTQTGVKKIFADHVTNEKLAAKGVMLSSANSINWGRLVPQIVYYFSAYADLVRAGEIVDGEAINFTVPTGNFGNILAGFYARQMGLPIHRLVCASNKNNILTDFLQTGYEDRNREFFKTISPSMDILVSSNVERLLWHLTGDHSRVDGWMREFVANGHYDVGTGMLQRLQNYFWAGWASEEETRATIRRVWEEHLYVLDPHTAVAWKVAADYRRRTKDERRMVILSTASPYKFCASVLSALGREIPSDPFAAEDALASVEGAPPVPMGLAALKEAKVLHDAVSDRENMAKEVVRFAADH